MAQRNQDQVERFLAAHQPAIAALIEQAQREAGGHYAALTPAERHEQARNDCRELTRDLLQGGPDPQLIRQAVQEAGSPTIPADIVRMSTRMEQLFRAYLERQAPTDPLAAEELLRRSRLVFARFRLNVTTGSIETLMERFGHDPPSGESHRPPDRV